MCFHELIVNEFEIDVTPPVIAEITPIPNIVNTNTPSYTFSCNESGLGTIENATISGNTKFNVINGNNTIILDYLDDNTYNSISIIVDDIAENTSNINNSLQRQA